MSASIPKGTRDFTPEETEKRRYIFNTIETVFRKYGFRQIETPAMENLSTLTGKYGEEGDKLLFKIVNSGEFLKKLSEKNLLNENLTELDFIKNASEKGLRYDLTVPLARFVVMNRNDIKFPFRRYQIQPVWRADKPQRGRYREFYQCDADILGSDSMLNEAELVMVYAEAFAKLGLSIQIKINNRKVLEGLINTITPEADFNKVAIAIDKLDKIGVDGVLQQLENQNINRDNATELLNVLAGEGDIENKLKLLETKLATHEKGEKGIEELKEVIKHLQNVDFDFSRLEIDLTLARGLDYYTGCIFEVTTNEVKMGSLGGGGRYDDLTGVFGLKGVSGVGISFGADRIYDVLEETNKFPQTAGKSIKVLICSMNNECFSLGMKTANKLREAGISCMIYPDAVKMKKQLDYANALKIDYAIIIGETELASEQPALKNLETGEQSSHTLEELVLKLGN